MRADNTFASREILAVDNDSIMGVFFAVENRIVRG